MQPAVPHQILDRLTLLIVTFVLAASATYLQVAHPSWDSLAGHLHITTKKTAAHTEKPVAKPTPAPVVATPEAAPAATTPAPEPTPTPAAPAVKTTTTNAFVHLRAGKSVSSAIVTDLNAGTTVELRDDSDAQWQGVTYQGKQGYIFRQWLNP